MTGNYVDEETGDVSPKMYAAIVETPRGKPGFVVLERGRECFFVHRATVNLLEKTCRLLNRLHLEDLNATARQFGYAETCKSHTDLCGDFAEIGECDRETCKWIKYWEVVS